jgi:glutamate-ammonia-ligase adenylyltransferase
LDLRLRPSGNKGPVATSLESFSSYQRNEAWVWEHLALTRAEVIAGPTKLSQTVEALRTEVLKTKRDAGHVCKETQEMRGRIAAAKTPDGVLDAKIGAGRLQDIELFAQAGALIGGTVARDIPAGLAAAQAVGILTTLDEEVLNDAYAQLWALQSATRLLSSRPLHLEALRAATRRFLIHAVGTSAENDTATGLEAQLAHTYRTADAIISAALSAHATGDP